MAKATRTSAHSSRSFGACAGLALALVCCFCYNIDLIRHVTTDRYCGPQSVCLPGREVAPFWERDDITQTSNVYKMDRLVEARSNTYQTVEMFHHLYFGHVLVIDHALMTTEKDEFYYHEMMVHVPLNYLPNAKRVLIIGGGDGGTLARVLTYTNIVEVILVDIDKDVVEMSARYLPTGRAFSNPRARIVHADGAHFVKTYSVEQDGGKFDAILVDSTDFGSAETLFRPQFYSDCHDLLETSGVMAVNVDTPSWHLPTIARASKRLGSLFANAHLYHSQVPSFISGHYSFMMASHSIHPMHTAVDWKRWRSRGVGTRYYTPDVHYASFALPAYLEEIVGRPTPRLRDVQSWD